jgi:hypothetical protein
VTERKPPGVSWQTWIDRQIEAGQAEGRFDDLPGLGKPLPGIDQPRDELWWVRDKLRREGVDHLPPSLAILRTAADAERRAMASPSEPEVRRIIEEVNEEIRRLNRTSSSGPPTTLAPFDVEDVVARWRRRPDVDPPADADDPHEDRDPRPEDRSRRSTRWSERTDRFARPWRRGLSRGWRRSP